jgi:hypothetical protein
MDLPTLAAIAGIIALPTTLLLWMMSKLHNDMSSLGNKLESHQTAINARVDTTQAVIMRMLEKQGK